MKSVLKALAVALALAAPVVSFAQSTQPLTRAQVRADLVAVEKAGYKPHDWIHYPENIQAAEAKVAAQTAAGATSSATTNVSASTVSAAK